MILLKFINELSNKEISKEKVAKKEVKFVPKGKDPFDNFFDMKKNKLIINITYFGNHALISNGVTDVVRNNAHRSYF